MENPLSFGETWTLIGVCAAAIISFSLKWLFAVCAALMDLLRWVVLGLHGNQGPGGVNGPIHKNDRRRLQDLIMQRVVSRNLHSRLTMEKNLMKMSDTVKRESKEVQIDWALIEKYLVDLNLNGRDKQEQTSNLETEQLQDSETPSRAEISTAQGESLLQNEFPPQEPPAELHPQQPQSSLAESYYTQYISSV